MLLFIAQQVTVQCLFWNDCTGRHCAPASKASPELIEEIRLVFENDRLEIALTGALAGLQLLAQKARSPSRITVRIHHKSLR